MKGSMLVEDSVVASTELDCSGLIEVAPMIKKTASSKFVPINKPAKKLFFMMLRVLKVLK
jgi:hypothetical protein